jgi:Domain of unknown function (DUF4389)
MNINKEHVLDTATWTRGLFILLFAIIYKAAETVLWLMVVGQFGFKLLTGRPNPYLLDFSQQLSTFIYQLLLYITFKSDSKPFPFSGWPAGAYDRNLRNKV